MTDKETIIPLGELMLTTEEASAVLDTLATPGWKQLERLFKSDMESRAFSFLLNCKRDSNVDRVEELGIVEGAVGYASAMLELSQTFKQVYTEAIEEKDS